MDAKAPAKPRKNWARISKVWLPISSLPTGGGTPVVLANEDQTVTWFCEKPNTDPVKHTEHARDERGAFRHSRKDERSTEQPVIAETVIKPAWWSPAVYVDHRGEPI